MKELTHEIDNKLWKSRNIIVILLFALYISRYLYWQKYVSLNNNHEFAKWDDCFNKHLWNIGGICRMFKYTARLIIIVFLSGCYITYCMYFQHYLFMCYLDDEALILCYASKSCNMFAHSFQRLTFYSLLLLVLYFSLLLPFFFFFFFFLLFLHLVPLSENIHGSKKKREEELLYAVKYFSGISHVDPFTAGSISLELWHFRRKISSLSFPGIFSHLIRFYIVVFLKLERLLRVSYAEKEKSMIFKKFLLTRWNLSK